jgi:hypothetical protein
VLQHPPRHLLRQVDQVIGARPPHLDSYPRAPPDSNFSAMLIALTATELASPSLHEIEPLNIIQRGR